MISDKVISISELKTQPSKYINLLKTEGDKYIFVHSKPKAVLVDVDKYEAIVSFLEKNKFIIDDEENLDNALKSDKVKNKFRELSNIISKGN